MRTRLALLLAMAMAAPMGPSPAAADELNLPGAYTLVSATRKILDTGETVDPYGTHPSGLIVYTREGRFLMLITSSERPRPDSLEKMTDPQRAQLLRTMTSYGGTYTLAGNTIEHHVDISWNEVLTGTIVIRDLARDGNRLTYVTRPGPNPADGKMAVTTLVWEKVE